MCGIGFELNYVHTCCGHIASVGKSIGQKKNVKILNARELFNIVS